jgi:hypothetical protein
VPWLRGWACQGCIRNTPIAKLHWLVGIFLPLHLATSISTSLDTAPGIKPLVPSARTEPYGKVTLSLSPARLFHQQPGGRWSGSHRRVTTSRALQPCAPQTQRGSLPHMAQIWSSRLPSNAHTPLHQRRRAGRGRNCISRYAFSPMDVLHAGRWRDLDAFSFKLAISCSCAPDPHCETEEHARSSCRLFYLGILDTDSQTTWH